MLKIIKQNQLILALMTDKQTFKLNKQKIFNFRSSLNKLFCNDVRIDFLFSNGSKFKAVATEHDTLLDVVVNNDIEIDGFGACGGTASCSTCHLIFRPEEFKIIGKPSGNELDMLDLMKDYTETSRLGCQVTISKEMDGFQVIVPSKRKDMRET